MTAPRRFTAEEMLEEAVYQDTLIVGGDGDAWHADQAAAMLRQSAADSLQTLEMRDWQHTSFCSAQPDGTLLCPLCDQSEARGHAPDCCALQWAKAWCAATSSRVPADGSGFCHLHEAAK